MGNMEAARLILDTDVIVDQLRGKSRLIETALDNFRCAFTAITIYELKAIQEQREDQRAAARRPHSARQYTFA